MREYLLVFLVSAAVTYLLTVIAREIALRTGAVAEVRDRDVHAEPIPYLGGVAMLGGLVAAYAVARELPFLSSAGPFLYEDAGVVILAGRDGVRRRRPRRPLRARRPDQARRPGHRRRLPDLVRHPAAGDPDRGAGAVLARPRAGRTAHRGPDHRHGQRGELRGRARRPRLGRGHDRCQRVLPLQLPAGQPQRRHPRQHRGLPVGRARRGLRGVPAAQLPPGPTVHGRQRVDADRAGALRLRADPHRPSSAAPRSAAAVPPPRSTRSRSSCRCCCRSRS